jgi:gluconolactonase
MTAETAIFGTGFHGVLPGSGFDVIDPRFNACVIGHARLERLWTGGRWLEGPAWFPAGRYLAFSDIPNDRLLRFDETDGSVSVFRQPSNYANGNTTDGQGRLVTAEHGGRRITRTEHDGSLTVLADRYNGLRLNSPNDVVVKSDGSIWFTDPPYGILIDYEGHRAASEIGRCNVYRVDGQSGAISIATDAMDKPNGLAFSPDERFLYVADTGASHTLGGPRHIRRFDLSADGTQLMGPGPVFAECSAGLFDGFRLDTEGRLWTSAADGVHCYHPDGTKLGRILVPELVSNVCFGGPKRNRLFICGTTSLYSAYLAVNGVAAIAANSDAGPALGG